MPCFAALGGSRLKETRKHNSGPRTKLSGGVPQAVLPSAHLGNKHCLACEVLAGALVCRPPGSMQSVPFRFPLDQTTSNHNNKMASHPSSCLDLRGANSRSIAHQDILPIHMQPHVSGSWFQPCSSGIPARLAGNGSHKLTNPGLILWGCPLLVGLHQVRREHPLPL